MGCGCSKGRGNLNGQRNLMKVNRAQGGTYGNTRQSVVGSNLPAPALRQMAVKKQQVATIRKEEQEKVKKIRQRAIRNKLAR